MLWGFQVRFGVAGLRFRVLGFHGSRFSRLGVSSTGFRVGVRSFRYEVSDMGFRGLGLSSWGFRVRGYAFREFGVSGTGFLVICSGFRGRGARFGVLGTGFRG